MKRTRTESGKIGGLSTLKRHGADYLMETGRRGVKLTRGCRSGRIIASEKIVEVQYDRDTKSVYRIDEGVYRIDEGVQRAFGGGR